MLLNGGREAPEVKLAEQARCEEVDYTEAAAGDVAGLEFKYQPK